MSRNPVGLALAALLAVAQFACALSNDGFSPQVGEMSVVFPQNDTYAVVSPFPIIFGYQNAPALLSYNSELSWRVECYQNSLYGADRINGYDYAEVTSGDFYVLNSSKTLQDFLPSGDKNPKGPYAYWRGEQDACSLSWTFHYWTICSKQPDGATLIQAGVGERSGKVYFTTRPGAKLPKDAIRDYQGCAVKGTAEQVLNSSISCPDLLTQPEAQPCKLDVKAVASSLAAAAVSPTTSFTGTSTPTSTTSATSTTSDTAKSTPKATSSTKPQSDGGGAPPKNENKNSATTLLARDSTLMFWGFQVALLFAILY
ncbi:hypothetical protein NLG97_g3515 [Lecanicillium saksenae]|uniref:Uncharacterized protein n=1 Tax=Lecanicillium saksenae TaxID=468837 RepID=A0ACC1QZ33_9HYPO|nr:hypothetical protein NLG97_g3515 [Lecanicillium saksenae]